MIKIRKGDKVAVISGKDKGKTGKVVRSLPAFEKVVVEGINVRKKHIRPKKEGQKGQIVQMPSPVNVSNVKIICPKCEKPSRVGSKILKDGRKIRTCKKCGEEV